ncbi:MAG: hypothetical protein AB1631_01895 [Acidobacteriota bacterium]
MKSKHRSSKLAVFSVLLIVAVTLPAAPRGSQGAGQPQIDLHRTAVPDVNVNLTAAPLRAPTAIQQAALDQFKAAYGERATVRWDRFAGSPDVMMGFHTAPSSDTPEQAARAFIAANESLLSAFDPGPV